MKIIVIGIFLVMSGCANRPVPDCEAHLVPIQIPTLPIIDPVSEPSAMPMPAPSVPEPHL